MRRRFYFDSCHRKGQIRRHYDGKNFRQKFVISGSLSMMQQFIITLVKTSIKHTLNKVFKVFKFLLH